MRLRCDPEHANAGESRRDFKGIIKRGRLGPSSIIGVGDCTDGNSARTGLFNCRQMGSNGWDSGRRRRFRNTPSALGGELFYVNRPEKPVSSMLRRELSGAWRPFIIALVCFDSAGHRWPSKHLPGHKLRPVHVQVLPGVPAPGSLFGSSVRADRGVDAVVSARDRLHRQGPEPAVRGFTVDCSLTYFHNHLDPCAVLPSGCI